MKIYFARHGQTDWNIQERLQGTTDIPLNATGINQAEQLSKALSDKGIKLKKVYSSNLGRARETAQIVCDKHGVKCQTLDDLHEICFGIFEGHTWNEIGTLFPEPFERWKANKRYTVVPEGESYQLALERMFRALDSIEELREDDTSDDAILIVTHGGVLKAMLTVLKDVPFENNGSLEVPNAAPLEFSSAELAAIKSKL